MKLYKTYYKKDLDKIYSSTWNDDEYFSLENIKKSGSWYGPCRYRIRDNPKKLYIQFFTGFENRFGESITIKQSI